MSFEILKPRSEAKFTKPTPGSCPAVLGAVVWHGLCEPYKGDATAKPQKKFSLIFMTDGGATIFHSLSWSWGDKASYTKLMSAWIGRPAGEAMIDPHTFLGKEVTLVLVEGKTGKIKVSTVFGAMPSAQPRVFATEVFIPSFLQELGEEYEIHLANGFTARQQNSKVDSKPGMTPEQAGTVMQAEMDSFKATQPKQGDSQALFAKPQVDPNDLPF